MGSSSLNRTDTRPWLPWPMHLAADAYHWTCKLVTAHTSPRGQRSAGSIGMWSELVWSIIPSEWRLQTGKCGCISDASLTTRRDSRPGLPEIILVVGRLKMKYMPLEVH